MLSDEVKLREAKTIDNGNDSYGNNWIEGPSPLATVGNNLNHLVIVTIVRQGMVATRSA